MRDRLNAHVDVKVLIVDRDTVIFLFKIAEQVENASLEGHAARLK